MAARAPVLVLLLVAACAGAEAPRRSAPARPPGPADFFPLAVGNTWTYLDRSPQQSAASHHTVRIVRREAGGYFADDQRGALRVEGECLQDRVRRLLCAPLRPGHGWTSIVSPSVTEHYRIVAVEETVTVPAGTFAGCVRVRSQARVGGGEQIAELTYAPGVGLVRLETFAVREGPPAPQVHGELESYRLVAGK